jgi:peptidoglycan/LPS O-acetylase OafA/YrhL
MGYIVGIILRLNGLKSDQARMLLWTGLVGIVGGTILLNTGWNSMRVLTIGFPIALFVLGLATLEQKKTNDSITNVLTTPWLVWLGRTSYVIYLSHSMFFQVWKRILPVTQLWALPMTIGAILLGALGYAFWEYPVLTYLKRGKWMIHRVPGISMLNSKPWRDNATE